MKDMLRAVIFNQTWFDRDLRASYRKGRIRKRAQKSPCLLGALITGQLF